MPEIVINGHRTEYWVTGTGEPLLWIMGTGMSGRAWHRYQVPDFAADYQCITYDMRGVGAAECPPEPYTPRLLAEDVIALLDALNVPSAHMVGFSLGASTVQEIAIGWPDRIKSAVLLSTWGKTADEHHIRRHYQSRIYALEHASPEVFGRFAFWMWSPTLVDDEYDRICELETFLKSVTGSAEPSGFIGHFAADIAHDTIDRLPAVSCPALVVHGDEDLITLPRYNARVAQAMPQAVLEEIPRAGHLAYLEQPAAVNGAIARFLGDVVRTSGAPTAATTVVGDHLEGG